MGPNAAKHDVQELIDKLQEDYHDLQAPLIDEYDSPPNAIETLRMVHKNHPALIKNLNVLQAIPNESSSNWADPEHYARISGDALVSIAVSDDGWADSVRTIQDGSTTFVKPLEVKMSVSDFLYRLNDPHDPEVLYLQSQDGNIYRSDPGNDEPDLQSQLAVFRPYIQPDVSSMREALGSRAEAVNLWIGTSRSTTSMHHDPSACFENIYHVLAGSKTFTLISPIDGLWLDQRFHPPSTLQRNQDGMLEPRRDPQPSHPVPWIASRSFPFRTRPMRVTVREGESLYLPAGWWHQVEQTEGSGGIAVAVNYWYTSTIDPQRYALERLARRTARASTMEGVIPVAGDESD